MIEVPAAVAAFAERGPRWAAFVDALPRTVDDLLDAWALRVAGGPMHGEVALVLPVLTDRGVEAVLKVGLVDEETRHEHLTLTTWDGRGAVRMLRADPARGALLLERAGPTALSSLPALEACEVVAGLYATLHVGAPRRLVPLSSLVGRWTEQLAAAQDAVPAPRRLVQQAVSLGRAFASDPSTDGLTIRADLHDANVLASRRDHGQEPGGSAGPWAAERSPWLVIDPKGISGDPCYEPAPLLWNRWEEVTSARDVRFAVRRRFHTVVDVAGLDEHRVRDWVVVRMMLNALWTLQDAQEAGRSLDAADRAWATRCVTVAKAVQD
ncbi:MAG: aminoglycoside resistance protein [Propionibacteriales bacterium]|nr:aminoglycoside resistance protein [Propionibacteriales bacterium]